jgi:hypothetical protein
LACLQEENKKGTGMLLKVVVSILVALILAAGIYSLFFKRRSP